MHRCSFLPINTPIKQRHHTLVAIIFRAHRTALQLRRRWKQSPLHHEGDLVEQVLLTITVPCSNKCHPLSLQLLVRDAHYLAIIVFVVSVLPLRCLVHAMMGSVIHESRIKVEPTQMTIMRPRNEKD